MAKPKETNAPRWFRGGRPTRDGARLLRLYANGKGESMGELSKRFTISQPRVFQIIARARVLKLAKGQK